MPLLHINSSQRTGGSPENFKINIRSDLRISRRFKIANVDIPNTNYPVNNNNNVLEWLDSGANLINSTIPVGSYSPTELAAILSTTMSTDSVAGDVVTVTVDNAKSKFNFATDTPNMIFPVNSITTAGKLTGINPTLQLIVVTNANAHNVFNTSGCNEYFVRSDFQPRDLSYEFDGTKDILAKIPVTGNFGDTLFYQPYFDWYYVSNPKVINNFYMRLTDCDGNELDLNGQDWSITLWIE